MVKFYKNEKSDTLLVVDGYKLMPFYYSSRDGGDLTSITSWWNDNRNVKFVSQNLTNDDDIIENNQTFQQNIDSGLYQEITK